MNWLWKRYSPRTLFFVALGVVLLDQFSKHVMRTFFSDVVVYNTGAAFSLFEGWQTLFAVVGIVVIAVILFSLRKYPYLELGLLLGGVAGNVIDRLVYGAVIDFIHAGWWPTFNLADAASTLAVVLLLLREVFQKH